MATDRLRAIGDRLWGTFSAATAGTSSDNQELEDDGLEMQVRGWESSLHLLMVSNKHLENYSDCASPKSKHLPLCITRHTAIPFPAGQALLACYPVA